MGSKKSRKQKRSLKAPKLRGYLCQDEPMMKGVSDERNLPGGKTMLKQRLCEVYAIAALKKIDDS
jgi:hypothetical protein